MVNVKPYSGWLVFAAIAMGVMVVAGCGGGGVGAGQAATTGSVTGLLVHAGTGLALGGIEVAAGGVTTTSGNDGTFTLDRVPAGQQTLTVTPDPARDLALPPGGGNILVDVTGGQTTQLQDPILLIDATDLPPNPPS